VGLDVAIDLGRDGRLGAGLAIEGGLLPVLDESLADAGDRIDVHPQGLGDPGVGPRAFGSVAIAEEEDLSMADLLGGSVPVGSDLLKSLLLFRIEPDLIEIRGRYHG
jgi:hypothetical protein